MVFSELCNKRGFYSKHAALVANKYNRARLRAYLCDCCKLWHVTRMSYDHY